VLTWVYGYGPGKRSTILLSGIAHPFCSRRRADMFTSVRSAHWLFFVSTVIELCITVALKGETVNQHFQSVILRRLWEDIWRKRSDKWPTGDGFPHQHNAAAHSTLSAQEFLAKKWHDYCSTLFILPRFGTVRLFFFPKLKMGLKRIIFDIIIMIQKQSQATYTCWVQNTGFLQTFPTRARKLELLYQVARQLTWNGTALNRRQMSLS